MGRLEGKVALITGASSGIGRACVERFRAEGAIVAATDIKALPPNLQCDMFQPIDVRNEASIESGVQAVMQAYGKIDTLINSAGVSSFGQVHAMDVAQWDLVLDINLKGTMLMSKYVLAGMMARRQGSIIHLSSIEGLVAADFLAAYNASKGAVIGLTRNMAIDYGPHNIRVNCICPGYIATPMTEPFNQDALKDSRRRLERQAALGRMGQPSEIAAVALFLASDDASYVTGHPLVADGGFLAGHRIFDME